MRWREGEVVVLSSASRIRPRKRLRTSTRCSIPNLPDTIVFLPRDERRPADPQAVPRVVPETGPTSSPDAVRPYRYLDAVVTFGGVTLLGALIGFVIGERLSPSASGGSTARADDISPSLESLSAERGPAYPLPALALASSTGTSPFEPPWRDGAAMRRGNSPVSTEAFADLVGDNRRLNAEIVALEEETMSLEMALLDRELMMFSAGLSFDDAESMSPRDAAPAVDAAAGSSAISPVSEEETAGPIERASALPELALFPSESTGERLEPSAVGDRAIASAALGAPQQRLVVADVQSGSAAESVGLRPGDILLAINDEEVHDMDNLIVDMSGGLHELTIFRDGASFPLAYADDPAGLSLRLDWVDPVFNEY